MYNIKITQTDIYTKIVAIEATNVETAKQVAAGMKALSEERDTLSSTDFLFEEVFDKSQLDKQFMVWAYDTRVKSDGVFFTPHLIEHFDLDELDDDGATTLRNFLQTAEIGRVFIHSQAQIKRIS